MMKLMQYSGTKINYYKDFKHLTKDLHSGVYVEPFLGSGGIFVNLPNSFDQYILNDFNPHIVSVWEFVRDSSYQDLIDIQNEMQNMFGDIKIKKNYYDIREYYNQNYFKTTKPERGGYLYLLINSCLNSFARFGPNGFNQSFGERTFCCAGQEYNHIKNKLKKSIITNLSYEQVHYPKDALVFLDPPYFKRQSSYSNEFCSSQLNTFLDFFKNKDCNIVYTDIESSESDVLLSQGFNKNIIRDIINTSATTHKEVTGVEVAYYNFNEPKSEFEDWL